MEPTGWHLQFWGQGRVPNFATWALIRPSGSEQTQEKTLKTKRAICQICFCGRLFLSLGGWPCTVKNDGDAAQLVPNKKVSQARTNEGSTITPPHTNTQPQQSLLCKFINKNKPVSIELRVLLFGRNRNPVITEVQHQPVTIQTSYTSEDKLFHNTLDRSCQSSRTMPLSFFPTQDLLRYSSLCYSSCV